jgi:antibiotic biosynthesis monooxygenase (ABM) superfamily enzyme
MNGNESTGTRTADHTWGDALSTCLLSNAVQATPPPPKWKAAVVTLLGVYPTSLVLGATVGRWTSEWHLLLRTLAIAGSMVVLLNWIVLPLLSRGLRRPAHQQDWGAPRY